MACGQALQPGKLVNLEIMPNRVKNPNLGNQGKCITWELCLTWELKQTWIWAGNQGSLEPANLTANRTLAQTW